MLKRGGARAEVVNGHADAKRSDLGEKLLEVVSIPRATGKKSKDITARLGKPQELNSVSETRQRIAKDIAPKIASYLTKARADANAEKSAIEIRRQEMQAQQKAERAKLDAGQKSRAEQEVAARSARLRKGLRGLLDRVTGKRAALERQNQMEAIWSLQRDREQRHVLIEAQLKDRQSLQAEIVAARARHAEVLRGLHHDRTNNRLMVRGLEPLAKKAFSPLKRVIDAAVKIELSAKPVTDLGKQQLRTLSGALEARGLSETKGPAKPISPQQVKAQSKTPAKDGKSNVPVQSRNPQPVVNKPVLTKAKSAIQPPSNPERMTAEKTPRVQSSKAETRSVKQAYAESQKKISAERVKTAQERLEKLREDQQQKPTVRVRQAGRDAIAPQDRLQRLREGQTRKPRGPELDR